MYTCLLQGVCIRSVHFDSAGFQLCKRDDCGGLSYTRNLNITLTTGSLAKKSQCGQLTRFLAKISTKIYHTIIQETLVVSSTSILSSLQHCTTTLQREQTQSFRDCTRQSEGPRHRLNKSYIIVDYAAQIIVLSSGPLIEPERLPTVV